MSNARFQVGDIVIRKNGKKPAEIAKIYSHSVFCKYLHNERGFSAYKDQIIKYEGEDEMSKEQLYSFKKEDGTIGYGTHQGTNSMGLYLIEVKGSGEILAIPKSNLEEVLPYTFAISRNGSTQQYIGVPGSVKVGDFLIEKTKSGNNFVEVVDINTKSKSAIAKFRGVRLIVEKFETID